MSAPTVRLATREDIEAFSDLANKPTVWAWVGELDGKIIGIGGFAFSAGRWFAFVDLKEEARPYKVAIMRAWKLAMSEAKRQGLRFVYAEAGRSFQDSPADVIEPNAVRWLMSLGFDLDPRSQHLYRWKNG